MKLKYEPRGGRFGDGFDYFCAECEEYVGNSCDDDVLEHPTTTTTGGGLFKKKTVTPIFCPQAGMKCKMQLPTIEILNL